MPFGQPSGPPASAKQTQELLELLQAAGHIDFRDARGPMGFTQRQAAGKFTRDEASAFIGQLQSSSDDRTEPNPPGKSEQPSVARRDHVQGVPGVPQVRRVSGSAGSTAAERAIRRLPTEQLAAELQRRGWIVVEP